MLSVAKSTRKLNIPRHIVRSYGMPLAIRDHFSKENFTFSFLEGQLGIQKMASEEEAALPNDSNKVEDEKNCN